ncbi:EspA/EspE family type VII secretion system effector [Mycolicibacterium parafortuitum]|uniref:ESX-1 secretion-associated protein EspA/EspE-like domain-containing protein n=1 Tax=Mycolicibacterium parafortuitum TaxID=39692 RepID=A0A375YBA5_MYCPF|nr:EspA/EspE family type VII secretion system effector [Mycolicibacterium parafortuitum]ORB31817.1 hypothetical protein BST38_03430 [Mycolicibacterium parafortuitum]SRX78390.1 hypothetical protein MPP7335_00113 [Mycolicibacterium parafortuitum]
MSVLGGFLTTWSQARATFGAGIPRPGSGFDDSPTLRALETETRSASPGAAWSGTAADAYDARNAWHARTLARLADLDRRVGAEVDRSAAVVAHGRERLDAIRQWVQDAAAAVPKSAVGEQMLLPIVGKGSGAVAEIVTASNNELAVIAERIRGIGAEYADFDGAGGADGVDALGVGDDAEADSAVPETTLDLTDIVYRAPGELGRPWEMELVAGSGVWVPNPNAPGYRPKPPRAPLDLDDIVYLPPVPDENGKLPLGPANHMELVPGSGAWVPDPNSPAYQPSIPEAPVDLSKIRTGVDPNALIPAGTVELWPHAGIIMPDPALGRPR